MENQPINRTEILILLLADMRNRRLMLGLQQAGLHPDDFYSGLMDLILQKAGFENYYNESLCTWYEETIEMLIDKDLAYFSNHQRELAKRMYDLLMFRKQQIRQDYPNPFDVTTWGRRLMRKWIR